MSAPACPRPDCTHAVVTTRDALGRPRARRVCQGIAPAGINAPTRAITQTPGAVCMAAGVGDPLVLRTAHLFRVPLALPVPQDDAPVPRGVRFVPLTPQPTPTAAPVNDRPCIVCLNPVAPDVRSKVCDACCPPGTRYSREQSRKARAALGFGGADRAAVGPGGRS